MSRMRSPKRWKDSAFIIHADAAKNIDYTLCGLALEEDTNGAELVAVTRGKINCLDCIAIIQAAKSIPDRFIGSRQVCDVIDSVNNAT